jgi:hypothetical protein
MSSMTVDGLATSTEMGPEHAPAGPGLVLAEPPAADQRDRLRPLEVAQCTMCGIVRPLGLLVPDGGQACADIRWYCKDAKSCTERWTAAQPPRAADVPTVLGSALTAVTEPAPDAAPADMLEPAQSAG